MNVEIQTVQDNGFLFRGNLSMWDMDYGQVIYAPQNGTTAATIITLVASSIGIGFSAVAVALLLLTAILFREWRQSYKNQVLIQFIMARFIYVLLKYFNNVQDVFGLWETNDMYTYYKMYMLLYTETTFVFWMLIFTREMHKSMVKVFDVNKSSMLKKVLWAWGLPILLSFILITCTIIFEDAHLKMHYAYLFLIKWPILTANGVLLCISLRKVLETNTRIQNNRRITIVMIWLIIVFCFQQFFLDIYKIVYILLLRRKITVPNSVNALQVAGNIVALYQFALSAIFWVFGNAKTRELWKFTPKNQRVISHLSSNVRISTKV